MFQGVRGTLHKFPKESTATTMTSCVVRELKIGGGKVVVWFLCKRRQCTVNEVLFLYKSLFSDPYPQKQERSEM